MLYNDLCILHNCYKFVPVYYNNHIFYLNDDGFYFQRVQQTIDFVQFWCNIDSLKKFLIKCQLALWHNTSKWLANAKKQVP